VHACHFPKRTALSEGRSNTPSEIITSSGRHIDERVRALIHSINGSFWVLSRFRSSRSRARGGAPHRSGKRCRPEGRIRRCARIELLTRVGGEPSVQISLYRGMSLPRFARCFLMNDSWYLWNSSWAINTERSAWGPSIRAIVSSPTTKHILTADGTDSGIKPEEIRHEYDRTMPGEVWDLLLKATTCASKPSTTQL